MSPHAESMLLTWDRKSLLIAAIAAGLIGLFVIFTVFGVPYVNRPQPARHSYLISAGGVSRAVLGGKDAPQSRPGSSSLPYRPHHVEFTAGNGPVDVYIVSLRSGDPQAMVDQMTQLTDALRAGQPPQEAIASGSGHQGRIEIPGWLPYSWAKYLALIRSQNESEVQLTVHYGP